MLVKFEQNFELFEKKPFLFFLFFCFVFLFFVFFGNHFWERLDAILEGFSVAKIIV